MFSPRFWNKKESATKFADAHFGLGFTIFPGQSFPKSEGYGAYSVGVNATAATVSKGRELSQGGKYVLMYVLGCIDYTFATDAANHHQTPFIVQVSRANGLPISPDDGTQFMVMNFSMGTSRSAD
jgi:hypothetical protein